MVCIDDSCVTVVKLPGVVNNPVGCVASNSVGMRGGPWEDRTLLWLYIFLSLPLVS